MREIKFRAWYKNKIWYMPDTMKDGKHSPISQFWEWVCCKKPKSNEDVFIMQFTDLLDKNGKEIYENDICKVKGGWSGNVITEMYYLYNHHFWVEVEDNIEQGATYEIIGNIYENPELLEVKS